MQAGNIETFLLSCDIIDLWERKKKTKLILAMLIMRELTKPLAAYVNDLISDQKRKGRPEAFCPLREMNDTNVFDHLIEALDEQK
ncbi:MAG TPA: hypothetical protein PLM24_08095 [Methanothrix sp.]|nr:hypothetical protein [Methanothrix sp.]HPJ84831.1 hypothetical protein [Methanothrix sp.]HPR67077.1 hypothetical protein [Methanothrix sp.]